MYRMGKGERGKGDGIGHVASRGGGIRLGG